MPIRIKPLKNGKYGELIHCIRCDEYSLPLDCLECDGDEIAFGWFDKNKHNVKYTLKAEYVKDGEKHETYCGQLITDDPIITILHKLLTHWIKSSGSGVSNPNIEIYAMNTRGTNVNASTTWLSASYNLSGVASGNFSITFSTKISDAVSGITTVSALHVVVNYGLKTNGEPYTFRLGTSTQGKNGCDIPISAGSVITWTLSGSIVEYDPSIVSSWYAMLWNEFWAEFIAATGVSNAPTGLWKYPQPGSDLFKGYSIVVFNSNDSVIGIYDSLSGSNTAIKYPTRNPGREFELWSTPRMGFMFTPINNDVLKSVLIIIYLYGSPPDSPYTSLARTGSLRLMITNINKPVAINTPHLIRASDMVVVSDIT